MPEHAAKKQAKRFVPSYARIAQDIESKIRAGELVPGAFLPGMRTLAKQYGVALGTVQQAVSILVADGALKADGWRGAIIAEPRQHETDSSKFGSGQSNGMAHPRRPATIGVIAPLMNSSLLSATANKDEWAYVMLRGLERAAGAEEGITMRFENLLAPDEKLKRLEDTMNMLIAEGVDAIAVIFVTSQWAVDSNLAHIDDMRVPTVFATANVQSGLVPHVTYDGEIAGFDAGRHLLARGYQPLVFIAPFHEVWIDERVRGVRGALSRSGYSEDVLSVILGDDEPNLVSHIEAGYRMAREYIVSRDIRGFGFVAANDYTAYGFIRAAKEAGLTAGADYGLVGFDDRSPSREFGLTTLAPPLELVGAEAGRLLIRMINGDHSPMQIRLRSHLIPRASTRPTRAAAERGGAHNRHRREESRS